MNLVLQSSERTLLSVSTKELQGITNALNEVCNGVHILEPSFETRLGATRQSLKTLLASLVAEPHVAKRSSEATDVWAEQGSLMVRAITAFGDPVEFGEFEALSFAEQVRHAAETLR